MVNASRQPKIVLEDYPYRQDIENRLFLAQLSVFEVQVLQEIVHHSLHISLEDLAKILDVTTDALLLSLEKLKSSKLFKIERSTLIVDKEVRKKFEYSMEKFEDDFEPNIEFLQRLFSKLPIHVLPVWYSISRTSSHIFTSIIENYLLTPKSYRQYLNELVFDNPILSQITKEMYEAPDAKLLASDVRKKYQLDHETFQKYVLLLEYHFIAFLGYEKAEDQWIEILTPFAEWREYLRFQNHSKPVYLPQNQIKPLCSKETVPLSSFGSLWNPRNLRLIEKSLRRLSPNQWVTFDQFFEGFSVPMGERELISLSNKGKKWKYLLPTYSEFEKQFVQHVITERLQELGAVELGSYQGKLSFCLTPFGHQFIH